MKITSPGFQRLVNMPTKEKILCICDPTIPNICQAKNQQWGT
jgi:hypothetical protein